jgi:hypothetical protein
MAFKHEEQTFGFHLQSIFLHKRYYLYRFEIIIVIQALFLHTEIRNRKFQLLTQNRNNRKIKVKFVMVLKPNVF